MPYYIAGEVPRLEDLMVVSPEEFERERGIKVHLRHKVEAIDPDRRVVEVADLVGRRRIEVGYDELVIATGARPIVPPEIDPSLPGVFVLKSLTDAEALKRRLVEQGVEEVLIVGAGYIGLEMAECLTTAGTKVTVIVRGPRVMSALDEEVSADILAELTKHGVTVLPETKVANLESLDGGRLEATLADGRRLTVGLVLVAVGVRPRSELAQAAGLELGARQAIAVDRRGRTSAEHIWAAGDCAEAYHLLSGRNEWVPLALTANRMGRVVGDNLAGIPSRFPGMLGTAVTRIFDLTVARTGLSRAQLAALGIETMRVEVVSGSRPHYYPGAAPVKTILQVETASQRVLGVQMVGVDGVGHRIDTWVAALTAGLSLKQVADLDLAYAPPFSPVWDPVLVAAEVADKKTRSQGS